MPFVGLAPEKARDLATRMTQDAAGADGLSSQVTAALTLSELESAVPGHLISVGDELDQVAIVISTRADIVDGFVIDPQVLASDLGITVAQAKAAIDAFQSAEDGNTAELTPILDVLVENKKQAEILRASFANLPLFGENPEVDEMLSRLALWLPAALTDGEKPVMADERLQDLQLLADLLDLDVLEAPRKVVLGIGAVAVAGPSPADSVAFSVLIGRVSEAYAQDAKLRTAAGLPTVEELVETYHRTVNEDVEFQARWSSLNEWLPAFLAGEGPASSDPHQIALALNLAGNLRWDGDGNPGETWAALLNDPTTKDSLVDGAFSYLRGNRFLQKALISGDFEDLDSPMIPITLEGFGAAIVAGQRNGILTEESQQRAERYAEQVLADPDGGDGPIELTEEHKQALIAAVIQQNGEDFVIEDPTIQRQLVATLLLIDRQPTLQAQQRAFADSIQALQSLATVGAPSMTFRQIEEAIGKEAAEELSFKDLRARTSDSVAKRPFYLSLLANWGVPGDDKIKTKKRKFKYEFSETGELVSIRKKKISKWKRFKNTIKAIGKSLIDEWKDNPWKYLFLGYAGLFPGANQMAEGVEDGHFDDILEGGYEMAKFAATAAAAAFPPSSSPAIVALAGGTVAAIDTAEAIRDDDWLGAIGSAFGAIGGVASIFKGAAVAGSTANLIATGARVGERAINTVQAGDGLVEAIDDGDVIGVIGSGLRLAGQAAEGIAAGSEFANSASVGLGGAGELVSNDLIESITDVGDQLGDLGQTTLGTGLVIEGVKTGDGLLVADGLVSIGRSQLDSGSRLDGQLKVVDEALDVAHVVDDVYRGGVVPDFSTLATELTDIGGAAATVPDAPVPLPPSPPKVGPVVGAVVGQVDLDGDGTADGIAIDADNDGTVDQYLVDSDGDGQTDQRVILAGGQEPQGRNVTPPVAPPPDGQLSPPDPSTAPIPTLRPSPILGDGVEIGVPGDVGAQQSPGGVGLTYDIGHTEGVSVPPNSVIGGQAVSTAGQGGNITGEPVVDTYRQGIEISATSGPVTTGANLNVKQIDYTHPPGGNPPDFVFDPENPINIPPGANVSIKTEGHGTHAGVGADVGLSKVPILDDIGLEAGVSAGAGINNDAFERTVHLQNDGDVLTVTIGDQSGSSVNANVGARVQTPTNLDVFDSGGALPDAPIDNGAGTQVPLPNVGVGVEVGASTGSSSSESFRLRVDTTHPGSEDVLDELFATGRPPAGATYERVVTESHGGNVSIGVSGNGEVLVGQASGSAKVQLSNEQWQIETVTGIEDGRELGTRRTLRATHAQVDHYFDPDGNPTGTAITKNVPEYLTGNSDARTDVAARIIFKPGEIERYNETIRQMAENDQQIQNDPQLQHHLRDTRLAANQAGSQAEQADWHFDLEAELTFRNHLKQIRPDVTLPGLIQFGP